MTISLLPSPRQRFYTNVSEPAAFYLLYTYDAGTVTPRVAYQDAAGQVPHTNPIMLDAKGEALVYFQGSYKIDVRAPDGSQVTGYPVDNFATLDASAITFQPAGTGAVAMSIEDALRETVSVKRFGAVSNGVTDDAAAIAKANTAAGDRPLVFVGVSHIGSPITITAPIADTLGQIFSLTSQVTIDNGQPVRPEWWGNGENTIHLAGLALPASGGVVLLRNKTYQRQNHAYNGKYWSKANVTIRGARMPTFTNDCKALTGGTIIQGSFLAFADNLAFENLGIDCGYTYTTNQNSSVATDGMFCTFNSDSAKAGNELKRGLRLHNIVGLCNAPGDLVHAVIACEGYANTVMTGDIVGMFGVHGVVIKAAGVRADTIRAYCNGNEGVIIKTDAQTSAVAADIQIGKIVSSASGPRGTSPYSLPSSAAGAGNSGLRFHCFAGNIYGVQIGEYINSGYEYGWDVVITPGAGYTLDSVQIGRIITRDNGTTGSYIFAASSGGSISRMQIGSVISTNALLGAVCVWTTSSSVKIEALHAFNCSIAALATSSSANPTIDTIIAESCGAAYQITANARPIVGKTQLLGTTSLYYQTASSGQSVPLSNGWAQIPGGDTYNVILANYGIVTNGALSGGTTNVLMTLPQFAWPTTEKRGILQGYGGGVQGAIPVVISTAGVVKINDVTNSIANVSNYVSFAFSYSLTN